MLNYQSSSFHDALYLRQLLALKPAPECEDWLMAAGVPGDNARLQQVSHDHRLLEWFGANHA